jgi:hypothetical protein
VFFFVIRVVLLLIVMFYVLFMCKCVLPPGVNRIEVEKYINISNVFAVKGVGSACSGTSDMGCRVQVGR